MLLTSFHVLLQSAPPASDFASGVGTLVIAISGLLTALGAVVAAAASLLAHFKTTGKLGAVEGKLDATTNQLNSTAATVTSHDAQLTQIAGNVAAAAATARTILPNIAHIQPTPVQPAKP